MEKQDAIELIKVNAPPLIGTFVSSVWHLDDIVKLANIAAMIAALIYTCFKIYRLWKHPKALDTVRGHDD